MAQDPAFLFYPGDYFRDTQCLSEPAQVAYDRIMCEHMRNICISQERLSFFTKRLSVEHRAEVISVLSVVAGGFEIPWVAESIRKRKDYSDSRRKNREGRGQKEKNISKSYVPHMENGNAIVNEDDNKIGGAGGKVLPAGFDDWFSVFFDEIIMEGYKSAFQDKDVNKELGLFKLKVRNAFDQYRTRDSAGMRNAFQAHLKTANNKKNGFGRNGKESIERTQSFGTDYGTGLTPV